MWCRLQKFLSDERGGTAIEYGLIAATIGLMLIALLPQISAIVRTLYNDIIFSRVLQSAVN